MLARSVTLTLLAASLAAVEPLIQPGDRYDEIRLPHLRVFLPAGQAESLGPLLARADAIFAAMALAAGRPAERLDLLLSDEQDDHNGFSTVIPHPLVQVLLAPAKPTSTIFDGHDHLERTLIHEFAHHFSNDRNHGFRGVLEAIFGRVLPSEYFSLVLFYLSTPAHVTMPRFWHEGLAQWAETAYADPASAWGGRGRDPLTHMIWRCDAAAGALPGVGEWRSTRPVWPFGSSVYVYGIAYFRWLESAYGLDAWRLVDGQAQRWAFVFNGGSVGTLGQPHDLLLARARNDLAREQRANLDLLRQQPVTVTRRLTPTDTIAAAPAWDDHGGLRFALTDPWDRPRLVRLDDAGKLHREHADAFARGALRRLGPGLAIRAETPSALDAWARSRVELLVAGPPYALPGERLILPDGHGTAESGMIAAIRLDDGGRQSLVIARYQAEDGILGRSYTTSAWTVIPSEGRAWSPAFAPDGERLAWVETDRAGSRLVVAPLADPTQRTVLWTVKGRIIHPMWSADGIRLFCCSDVSGVANAYAIDLGATVAVRPVTHVLGGVVACVPSPDGRHLAVVDHDVHGPYIATISADPATWPESIPTIACSWPAPNGHAPHRALALRPEPAVPEATPYHGLTRLRPLFWTPTTLAGPDGGYGVAGFLGDPLATHTLFASAGIGAGGYEGVGQLGYVCSTWPIEVGVQGWLTERLYNDLLLDSNGNDHTYVEWRGGGEVLAGRGLSGSRRHLFAYVAAGAEAVRTSHNGAEEYEDVTIVTPAAWEGEDQYVEATIGYGDTRRYPTSYARETGVEVEATLRRSGFGGDLDRTRLIGRGEAVLSVWPRGGHQIVVGASGGTNDGDTTLQGSFSVGGILGLGLPRGYYEIEAVGDHLVGGSVAYRLPLWRPFDGFGSSPFAHRQIVVEVFYDLAQVSRDHLFGDGDSYASAGMQIHDEWEFSGVIVQPGLGVARQLDGDEDTVVYFALGF